MTREKARQPSWQIELCPRWCVTEHRESDLPEDRVHDSDALYVPVNAPDNPHETRSLSAELIVAAYQRHGRTDTWLYLGHPNPRLGGLTVTPESAERLGRALIEFVERL